MSVVLAFACQLLSLDWTRGKTEASVSKGICEPYQAKVQTSIILTLSSRKLTRSNKVTLVTNEGSNVNNLDAIVKKVDALQ
jgi:hypothetical protein